MGCQKGHSSAPKSLHKAYDANAQRARSLQASSPTKRSLQKSLNHENANANQITEIANLT